MKSKAVLMGHPVHPMLIPFPFAFLTGAVGFDLAGWLRNEASWWTTGGSLAAAGIVTAMIAAVPGLIDYFATVPPDSSGKARARRHMILNLTAVGLFAIAWWLRGGSAARPSVPVIGLELLALALLAGGSYLGGTLVTRNLISVDHRYARAGKWRESHLAVTSNRTVTAAKADDLQVDQMMLLHVDGRRIVLARTARGFVAFDDRCTHRGGSLAGGVLICGTVQCLWHGSQFDVTTGEVKAGPATEGIRVYDVIEEAGNVKLRL